MYKFEKQFRTDNPQTIGETDRYFDLDNYKDWLEEKYSNQLEIIMSILGHGDPYPLETVLEKLKWATEYLLHTKNYDGHNYEELGQSVRRAEEILSILSSREAHFIS